MTRARGQRRARGRDSVTKESAATAAPALLASRQPECTAGKTVLGTPAHLSEPTSASPPASPLLVARGTPLSPRLHFPLTGPGGPRGRRHALTLRPRGPDPSLGISGQACEGLGCPGKRARLLTPPRGTWRELDWNPALADPHPPAPGPFTGNQPTASLSLSSTSPSSPSRAVLAQLRQRLQNRKEAKLKTPPERLSPKMAAGGRAAALRAAQTLCACAPLQPPPPRA